MEKMISIRPDEVALEIISARDSHFIVGLMDFGFRPMLRWSVYKELRECEHVKIQDGANHWTHRK